MKLAAKGDAITLSVNDTRLAAIRDDSMLRGRVGLAVSAWPEPFAARFSNLAVSAPE